MACGVCCETSCPAPVPVTVNLTTIEFDGSNAYFHQLRFSRAAGTVVAVEGKYILINLPHTPVSSAEILVAGNSGVMRKDADYVVSGSQIYLVNEAAVDSEYLVRWFSTEGAPSDESGSSMFTTGYLQAFYEDPGSGWLVMDGATSRSVAAYAALAAYLAMHPNLVVSMDASTFVLKALTSMVYTGTDVQTLNMYIHT